MTIGELVRLDDRRAAARGLYKFNSLHLAMEFAYRALKLHFVLHGDCGRYWVAIGHLARELERAGYEIVA